MLSELGYVVHTPAEVFGTREAAAGASDTVWLRRLARTGWLVISRDAKIMQRPDELAAYRAAALHLFLLPGEALAADLRRLTADNLAAICTRGAERTPAVWKITTSGVRRLTR